VNLCRFVFQGSRRGPRFSALVAIAASTTRVDLPGGAEAWHRPPLDVLRTE
jgi:hypothetical protein